MAAGDLEKGDEVYNLDGSTAVVIDSELEKLDEPILVYNLEVEDFHTYFVGCEPVLVHNSCTPKSLQSHHIATNKSSEWTSGFEEIANKYGLDLSGNWNIISIEHSGRHPWEYHSFVDDVMNYVDNIANGDTEMFKDMWKKFGEFLKENPGMLYSNFWRK